MTKQETITLTLPNKTVLTLPWKRLRRAKNIRVSVSYGRPTVSSPHRIDRHTVESFLLQQSTWLQTQLEKHNELPHNTLYYRGTPHELVFRDLPPSGDRIYRDVTTIVVHPIVMTTDSISGSLERWLQSQASKYAVGELQELATQMQISVPTLRFKETRSRWGSCSSNGAITLNWRLIHAPHEVLRYVVAHELAHRVHMNHSADFWELVESVDPDFRIHRGWLKRRGHLCRTPQILLSS